MDDPAHLSHLGVPELDADGRVVRIVEKPDVPASDYAVTGIYFYDQSVFEIITTLVPSGRGELEITDVNNWYVDQQHHRVRRPRRVLGRRRRVDRRLLRGQRPRPGPRGQQGLTIVQRGRLRPPSDAPAEGERFDRLVVVDGRVVVEQILSGRVDGPADYLQDRGRMGGGARRRGDARGRRRGGGAGARRLGACCRRTCPTGSSGSTPGTSWLAFHFDP